MAKAAPKKALPKVPVKKAPTIKKAAKPAAKPAAKKAAPKKDAAPLSKKNSTLSKKNSVPLSKKNSVPLSRKNSKTAGGKTLDLCLVLDCTCSMFSWIQRSKDTLITIIDQVKAGNPTLNVRVSFVGYRDFGDREQFSTMDFTEDLEKVKKYIASQPADGGFDLPEDVQGGFQHALGMKWEADSIKSVFHIADAPGHGKDIYNPKSSWCSDRYPNGPPTGYKIQDQMR